MREDRHAICGYCVTVCRTEKKNNESNSIDIGHAFNPKAAARPKHVPQLMGQIVGTLTVHIPHGFWAHGSVVVVIVSVRS